MSRRGGGGRHARVALPHYFQMPLGFETMDAIYVVYGLFDPVAEEIFYIGYTGKIKARIREHICDAHSAYWEHRTKKDQRIININESGESIICLVLAKRLNKYKAYAIEQKLIIKHSKTLLNKRIPTA